MRDSAQRSAAVAVLLILLSGCLRSQAPAGQPNPGPATAPQAESQAPNSAATGPHDSTYIIGDDDVLAINVWNEKDLSRAIPVRSDGKISLPLVGEMQAAGRTPLQLEGEIAEKLKSYITSPEVTVMVQEIKSQNFNILGQVAKPGSYPLTASPTIVDAIAAAGGFRDFAKQKGIYILRQGANGSQTRISFNYKDFIKGKNPAQNIHLLPHDTVVVP